MLEDSIETDERAVRWNRDKVERRNKENQEEPERCPQERKA